MTALESLQRQHETGISISRSLNPTGSIASTFVEFPFLQSRLQSKLTVEMESTSNVLKSYQRGMSDVHLAMQFAASDLSKALFQSSVQDVADVAAILVETVMDIQRLQWLIDHDHHRRIRLLESVLPKSSPSLSTTHVGAASIAVQPDAQPKFQSMRSHQEMSDALYIPMEALLICVLEWDVTSSASLATLSATDMLLIEHIVSANADRSVGSNS